MVGLVIPDLDHLLKDWLGHQRKTLQDWAAALHAADFMKDDDIQAVESVLDAAANRGVWEMDDPLTVAHEFLAAAGIALVITSIDMQMHHDVAKALYFHLYPIFLNISPLP